MPKDIEFLCVKMQGGTPCLWALVDDSPDIIVRTRKIRCAGTGHHIEERYSIYLGTVLMCNGNLVLHYFMEPI